MNRTGSKAVESFLPLHQRESSVPQQFSGVKSNVEHGGNSEENVTSDEDEDEDEDENDQWYPGDGICPSTSQFNTVYQASYDAWCPAAPRQTQNGGDNLLCIKDFLNLLDDVPAFFRNPPKDVDLLGGSRHPLTLRSSLHLETTEDPACEQHRKTIDYIQCIGFPAPMKYKVKSEASRVSSSFPVFTSRQSGYLTSIALAWSYILSCRWVEILQKAGENSSLSHDQGDEITVSFWDLVIRSRWSAQVSRGKRPAYAPWMLRRESSHEEIGWNMIQAPPNSSLAFDILIEYCTSEGLETELVTALAMVLMLTSRNAQLPKLAAPVMISGIAIPSRKRNELWERLFGSIDKCLCISSTQDAIDSLACSAFFDPSVPCNLTGAQSLGISEALLQVNNGYDRLIEAMADKRPHLTLLWAAIVCNDQIESILNIALRSFPPICLVAAFWTNTPQSFLQIPYIPKDETKTSIPRSWEFITSYFCRPKSTIPWSPAPPFGSTSELNLNLEVKQHYRHKHRAIRWRSYWILRSGEKVPATAQNWLKPLPIYSLRDEANDTESSQQKIEPNEQKIADERSFEATSRLFNWHRDNDGGLWLDDGSMEGIEAIRKLQQHQWIVNPFDDDGASEPLDEKKSSEIDSKGIWKWITEVDEHCGSPG